MEEQTQISENFEIPSRWRRFSAYLLDFLINFIIFWIIPTSILYSNTNYTFLIITAIIVIVFILFYLIFIINKKTTLWNNTVWIIALTNDNKPITGWQAILRYFVFYTPFLTLILFSFWFSMWFIRPLGWCINIDHVLEPFCGREPITTIYNISNRFLNFSLILCVLNLEIFFKSPTFIDKLLWIRRIYKNNK